MLKNKNALKVVGVILFIIFVAIIICFFLFGNIGVRKKTTQQSTVQSSTVQQQVIKPSESSSFTKPSASSSSSVQSSSSTSTQNSSSNTESKETTPSSSLTVPKKSAATTNGLSSIDTPTINSKFNSKAIVSEKSIYRVDTTYVFDLILTVATQDYGNVNVHYFTSENNYNLLKVGDLLSVDYGISNDGNIAIMNVDTVQ